ncbi:TPA: primosomal protein N' [Candidatus Dependentiae bacterium]|nr:MAG: primosomal protein N' [Lentisphaerae bacterium GWF2_44_16]HAU30566.1 primosomal protein N' [Candidatus Dependentiae bacterium]
MYARVQLLNGFSKPLTYQIPKEWVTRDLVGTVVLVPLQKRVEAALVTEQIQVLSSLEKQYHLRTIIPQETLPVDQNFQKFTLRVAQFYGLPPQKFLQKLQRFLFQKKALTVELGETSEIPPHEQLTLNAEQQNAWEQVKPTIKQQKYAPFLLYGVTGSGKTIIYQKAIEEAYKLGKTTIFLVPEVGLAVNFLARFIKYFNGSIPILPFHSASTAAQKRSVWELVTQKRPGLIIGVHLPTLLPIPNLGLIIIDEEHDINFQEQNHPKTNTREIAHIRAQTYNIPIIFGSATPSIHTLYTARERSWPILHLNTRFAGAPPQIEEVNLLEDKRRPYFWISRRLHEEIAKRLERKEQSIIFLNRRGFSFFIQCRACGTIFTCPNCSVSLTLHTNKKIMCHYCDYQQQEPTACSKCASKDLLKKGVGTQQLVQILETLFPTARIIRADLDTTKNKKVWAKTVESIVQGETDIIVGTQTITKGYHFPKVTLVGIIWADISLSIPKYNACEATLHQLIQVAGRAGRNTLESLAIVQYCSNHPIFSYLNEDRYQDFVQYELEYREKLGYPPYQKLLEFELQHTDETVVEKESGQLKKLLQAEFSNATILGPAKPPIHKRQNVHLRNLYAKCSSHNQVNEIITRAHMHNRDSKLHITLQPL